MASVLNYMINIRKNISFYFGWVISVRNYMAYSLNYIINIRKTIFFCSWKVKSVRNYMASVLNYMINIRKNISFYSGRVKNVRNYMTCALNYMIIIRKKISFYFGRVKSVRNYLACVLKYRKWLFIISDRSFLALVAMLLPILHIIAMQNKNIILRNYLEGNLFQKSLAIIISNEMLLSKRYERNIIYELIKLFSKMFSNAI